MKKKNHTKTRNRRIKQAFQILYTDIDRFLKRYVNERETGKGETLEDIENDVKLLEHSMKTIIDLQANVCVTERKTEGDDDRVHDAFVQWLANEAPNCGYNNVFKFDWNVKEGTGVVACKDVDANTLFMSIPRRIMMMNDSMLNDDNDPIGRLLRRDEMTTELPSLALAIHIWNERTKEQSFWKPYLDVLPGNGRLMLPLFWSFKQLQLLRDTSLYCDVLKSKRRCIRQYAHYYRLFQQAGIFNRDSRCEFCFLDFRWSVGIAMSRVNRIPKSNNENENEFLFGLIPGWDMCNFDNTGVYTSGWNSETDTIDSLTMNAVKEGQQIYIHYGDRPNFQLFEYQGFIIENHSNDYMRFVIPLRYYDKMINLLLMKKGLKAGQILLLPAVNQDISIDTLNYCRCVCATKDDAAIVFKNPKQDVISDNNEFEALKLLRDVVQGIINEYKTTLEEDEQQLQQQASLTPHEILALQVHISEKRILYYSREVVAKLLQLLKSS